MLLFLDTNNHLYLISLDAKRKATWIPLPSSSPGRESASVPKMPASKMAVSAPELEVLPQTAVNTFHQMPLEREASTMTLDEGQILASRVS
jgi:hypothetical protein